MGPEPNLVIIGAQKAGTTSLYHHLRSHPDIFMSYPVKEPGYFMTNDFVLRLFRRLNRPATSRQDVLTRYMLHGFAEHRYFGDASTYYTIGRLSEIHNVPGRMHRANPSMKLIYIVRHPFARIVSNYLHELRSGRFEGPFGAFVSSKYYTRALLTSCYWRQLSAYLTVFPARQIKVVLFEELVTDWQAVIHSIYSFLGIPWGREVAREVHNQAENVAEFDPAELLFTPEAFQQASRAITPDVAKLSAFMERGLDVWDLSMDRWCDSTGVRRPQRAISER